MNSRQTRKIYERLEAVEKFTDAEKLVELLEKMDASLDHLEDRIRMLENDNALTGTTALKRGIEVPGYEARLIVGKWWNVFNSNDDAMGDKNMIKDEALVMRDDLNNGVIEPNAQIEGADA